MMPSLRHSEGRYLPGTWAYRFGTCVRTSTLPYSLAMARRDAFPVTEVLGIVTGSGVRIGAVIAVVSFQCWSEVSSETPSR